MPELRKTPKNNKRQRGSLGDSTSDDFGKHKSDVTSQKPVKTSLKRKSPSSKETSTISNGSFDSSKSNSAILDEIVSLSGSSKREASKTVADDSHPVQQIKEVVDIYDVVKGGSALKNIMPSWFREWKADKLGFTIRIVDFIIKSCGIKGEMTRNLIDAMEDEMAKFVTKLENDNVNTLLSAGGTYPLIDKSKEFKSFRSLFTQFWMSLPEDMLSTSEDLLSHLINWTCFMSRSKMRAIRHTATFAVLCISKAITSIINSRLAVSTKYESAILAEKQNASKKQGLKKKIQEISQLVQSYDSFLLDIFRNVIMHRYRDIFADIRADTIKTLGEWIAEYPGPFLTSNYLKYIGWLLSDSEVKVRNASMQAYVRLYESDTLRPLLSDFTKYHKKRLENYFISDNPETAVLGFRALFLLYKHAGNIISESTLLKAHSMINHESALIRETAAKFLLVCLKHDEDKTSESSSVEKQIRLFLNAIEKIQYSDFPDYAVNALCNVTKYEDNILYAWKVIDSLLRYSKKKQKLPFSQQILLAKVLVASARTINGESVTQVKKPLKTNIRCINEFTSIMLDRVPELLNHFKVQDQVLESLVQLPKYFSFKRTVLQNKRELNLNNNVSALKSVFLTSTSPDVLDAVVSTLSHVRSKCESHRFIDVSVQEILKKLREALEEFSPQIVSGSPDEPREENGLDSFQLEVSLARLCAVVKRFSADPSIDFDFIFAFLERQVDAREENVTNQKSVSYCIKVCFNMVLWELSSVVAKPPSSGKKELDEDASAQHLSQSVTDEDTSAIMSRVERLVRLLNAALKSEDSDVAFCAHIYLCRMLRVFSPSMSSIGQQGLVYEAEGEVVENVKSQYEREMDIPTNEEDEVEIEKKEILCIEFYYLILNQVFGDKGTEWAPCILSRYLKHGYVVQECIRKILVQLKEKMPSYHGFELDALRYYFESHDLDAESFGYLRELSRHFSKSFAFAVKKEAAKRELMHVIRHGLMYALEDPVVRQPFLSDAVMPFLCRIDAEMARSILKELEDSGREADGLSRRWQDLEERAKQTEQFPAYFHFREVIEAVAANRTPPLRRKVAESVKRDAGRTSLSRASVAVLKQGEAPLTPLSSSGESSVSSSATNCESHAASIDQLIKESPGFLSRSRSRVSESLPEVRERLDARALADDDAGEEEELEEEAQRSWESMASESEDLSDRGESALEDEEVVSDEEVDDLLVAENEDGQASMSEGVGDRVAEVWSEPRASRTKRERLPIESLFEEDSRGSASLSSKRRR